jgi:hypothetical protein
MTVGIGMLAALLGSVVCFFWVVVRVFRARGVGWGLLGLVFGPYAFVWGWRDARRRRKVKVMTAWTACTVVFVGAIAWFVSLM